MSPLNLAFALCAAHFIVDFPLQGDTTAREKNPNSTTPLQAQVPWPYWMTAHASMHAAAVMLLTGSLLLAALEAVLHFIIDYGKCRDWFGIHADQGLHLACKALWFVAATRGLA